MIESGEQREDVLAEVILDFAHCSSDVKLPRLDDELEEGIEYSEALLNRFLFVCRLDTVRALLDTAQQSPVGKKRQNRQNKRE